MKKLDEFRLSFFTPTLLKWYDTHHRDLPWRKTRDPYRIWISEIILQQTRIGQGLNYYHRFLERFPDVEKLASAPENDILRIWQGLGYYSRARNLHHAAKEIVVKHKGVFPEDYASIRSLKGVGDYTAAAIASISFGLPCPVVDGNVLRFFSRYFGIREAVDKPAGKKAVLLRAEKQIDARDPGKFNQAVMEFGALVCKPVSPDCTSCPFHKSCYAFAEDAVKELPVKSSSVKIRKRYFNYIVLLHADPKKGAVTFLKKREDNDIWKNLYDFPLIETTSAVSVAKLIHTDEWKSLTGKEKDAAPGKPAVYKHILSHQEIHAKFYPVPVRQKSFKGLVPVHSGNRDQYPVSRLIDKYLGLAI